MNLLYTDCGQLKVLPYPAILPKFKFKCFSFRIISQTLQSRGSHVMPFHNTKLKWNLLYKSTKSKMVFKFSRSGGEHADHYDQQYQ